MKKLFLLSIGTACSFGVFAQSARTNHPAIAQSGQEYPISASHIGSGARTTAIGSSDTLTNLTGTDTLALYWAGSASSDSGFISGMDAYGDMGYAERYDFNTADSSLRVTGIIGVFGGTVSSTSTKQVKFMIWSQGAQVPITSTLFLSGLPNVGLDSINVNFTALGITSTNYGVSINTFAVPTPYLNHSFFAGCTFNYNSSNFGGDTVGVVTTKLGERASAQYNVVGADTIINDQNVTMYNDGSWNDNWASNFQVPYEFLLFPIVTVGTANLSVNGITTRNFTFFGSYPNPTADVTNIKFAVANSTDVTITITDAAGRTVNTINQANLAAGTHVIPVSTNNLPAGEYLYLVRTAAGEGMASKFTVIK